MWEDGEMASWGQLRVCKSQAIRPHMQLDEGEGVRTDDVINRGFPGPIPTSAARLPQRSWVAGRWDTSRRNLVPSPQDRSSHGDVGKFERAKSGIGVWIVVAGHTILRTVDPVPRSIRIGV